MSTIAAIGSKGVGNAISKFASQAIPTVPTAPLIQQATVKAISNPASRAAARKGFIWGTVALAAALCPILHLVTWPIALYAGYKGYKSFRPASMLRAIK